MKYNNSAEVVRHALTMYETHGFICHCITREHESQEYCAATFMIDDKHIVFRSAKITPTKIGQFVTLWKRGAMGPIVPYDMQDEVDLFVIAVRQEQHCGQFVFPKHILVQQGYVSKEGNGGKRAMRVYPPWDVPSSTQAERTQQWQRSYFFAIRPVVDSVTMHRLFRVYHL